MCSLAFPRTQTSQKRQWIWFENCWWRFPRRDLVPIKKKGWCFRIWKPIRTSVRSTSRPFSLSRFPSSNRNNSIKKNICIGWTKSRKILSLIMGSCWQSRRRLSWVELCRRKRSPLILILILFCLRVLRWWKFPPTIPRNPNTWTWLP